MNYDKRLIININLICSEKLEVKIKNNYGNIRRISINPQTNQFKKEYTLNFDSLNNLQTQIISEMIYFLFSNELE